MFILKNMNKIVHTSILFTILLACSSANYSSRSNTTMTVDYFGLHESTSGAGWDNPMNVERLFLGNSRPLVVVFARSGTSDSEALINRVTNEGLKEKVWIIDTRSVTTQLIQTLMNGGRITPTLVYMNAQDRTLNIEGVKPIIDFLNRNFDMLENITDLKYY